MAKFLPLFPFFIPIFLAMVKSRTEGLQALIYHLSYRFTIYEMSFNINMKSVAAGACCDILLTWRDSAIACCRLLLTSCYCAVNVAALC